VTDEASVAAAVEDAVDLDVLVNGPMETASIETARRCAR